MASRYNSPWVNEALTARMKELWRDHSATQIAGLLWDEFRVVVSRNAVVGRLHRDKVTVAQKTKIAPQTTRQRAPRIPRSARPQPFRSVLTNDPIELKALRCAEIVPLGIPLVDLEEGHCRYPYSARDESISFCGHPKAEGFSYCQPHANLARVVPVRPKPTLAGMDL